MSRLKTKKDITMPNNTTATGFEATTITNIDVGTIVSKINLFPFFKGGLIAIAVIYAIVSIVVIKQIYLMTRTVKSKTNKIMIAMAYLNLLIVLIVLLFALYL